MVCFKPEFLLVCAPANVHVRKSNRRCRLGVKTRIFHLGDYRRATIPTEEDMPDDYFFVNGEWNA